MAPIFAGYLEIIGQPLYDCVHLPAGWKKTRPFELFQIPIGSLRLTLKPESPYEMTTLHHTNLVYSGTLPAPNKFIAKKMRGLFLRDHRPVPMSDPIWFQSLVRFTINQKLYLETAAAAIADAVCYLPSFQTWDKWPKETREEFTKSRGFEFSDDGLVIDTQQRFAVDLDCPAVDDDTDFVIVLEGLYARSVQ